MKCFVLIKGDQVVLEGEKRIIPKDEMSKLLEAQEIVDLTKQEAIDFRAELEKEGERVRQDAKDKGFEEGLSEWNEKLSELEEEIRRVRGDLEKAVVPLAITAIRRILGREIELAEETIVDLVATSAKSVAQHRRVAIYVRRADLDILEKNRPRLKALFENLQSLTIGVRDDVEEGGCIIETERGIMNVSLEGQLRALEEAFKVLMKEQGGLLPEEAPKESKKRSRSAPKEEDEEKEPPKRARKRAS